MRTQAKSPKGSIENLQPKLPESQVRSDGASRNHFANSDQKTKIEDPHTSARSRRSKGYQFDTEGSNTRKPNLSNKSDGITTKS